MNHRMILFMMFFVLAVGLEANAQTRSDFNSDNKVDLQDLLMLSAQFGKTSASTGFNSKVDINADTRINLQDVAIFAGDFGKIITPSADGAALYANNCAGCHDPLAMSVKAGATFA